MDKKAPLIPQGVKDVANHYSLATGTPCMILDLFNKQLVGQRPEVENLFAKLDKEWGEKCFETHRHYASLAERFGGSYTYFTFLSLVYWVSPVIMDGRMEYAIIAGPVSVFEPEELLSDKLLGDERVKKEAQELLNSLAVIDVSLIHNLSEVLRMCAGWASGYSKHLMVEGREALTTQSLLSEQIQNLKLNRGEIIQAYPFEKEMELQEAIRWGDRRSAQRIMNELLGLIYFTSGASIERINFRVMELISLLSRAAVQGGGPQEEILEMSFRFQREVVHYTTIEGMSVWLSKVLHQFTDLVFASKDEEYGSVIASSIRYIRKNYRDKITLEETAQEVGLSPNYFSRIFNEKMNISFSAYINRLRVEQAQKLLLNTSLPIIEVAGLVGFDEQSYFSKVFKSVTHLSPGQYRKRSGRYESDNQEIHT
jgi:two-component system response regulator YesN